MKIPTGVFPGGTTGIAKILLRAAVENKNLGEKPQHLPDDVPQQGWVSLGLLLRESKMTASKVKGKMKDLSARGVAVSKHSEQHGEKVRLFYRMRDASAVMSRLHAADDPTSPDH